MSHLQMYSVGAKPKPAAKAQHELPSYRLTLSCRNKPGIVAAVSKFVFDRGGDVYDARQFDDRLANQFFLRLEFTANPDVESLNEWRWDFVPIVERFGMNWTLRSAQERKKVLIMVSKFDHCLVDLLYRARIGELPMDIAAIVSNYPRETYGTQDLNGADFYHLPVTPENKAEQEAKLLEIISRTGTEMVVLARYMQVLSDNLCRNLYGRCINVHHSFLPGFKGAKPYHQAHERGVKLIGATAHFVTSDLDEGPIIEQEVIRISHNDTPQDFVRKGRDVERQVLARGLRYFLEDRLFVNGKTTVTFPD